MLNFYRAIYKLKRNGETLVMKYGHDELLCTEPPKRYNALLTWENVEKIGLGVVSPKIKTRRKGKVLIYDDWDTYFCIKEWKEPVLDLEYSVDFEKVDMSLNSILDYHDGEKALLYILERLNGG